MTRVTILSTVHSWEDVRIFHKGCRTLEAAGYQVELLVPGVGRWEKHGIRVQGLGIARSRSARVLKLGWRALKEVLKRPPGIVHGHDPELLPLLIVARLRGHSVIYDAHEDLARQVLSKYWIPAFMRAFAARLVGVLMPLLARGVNAVVAATPSIAEQFRGSRVVLVRNLPLQAELTPGKGTYRNRPPHAAYVGGISVRRGLFEMIRASALVNVPGFELRIAGGFSPASLEGKARAAGPHGRFRLEGRIDREGVARLLGETRIGVVVFQPAPNHVDSLPNKLFEYMAAGIPVVASDFSTWRQIVLEEGCGVVVDPTDPAAIAGAITRLLESPHQAHAMGMRGRTAVENRYNWERESESLLRLYADLRG